MKRWVITLTAGAGYSQKYPPTVWLFKRRTDAIKFLRQKIKHYLKSEWEMGKISLGLEATPLHNQRFPSIKLHRKF